MKVYVIESGEHSDRSVMAVVSSLDEALESEKRDFADTSKFSNVELTIGKEKHCAPNEWVIQARYIYDGRSGFSTTYVTEHEVK